MFCQDGETSKKRSMCSVTTLKMSQRILEGGKCDHDLSLRVAGVNDLIAAEGRYHPNCYKRKVSRSRDIAKDESGTVLSWLIDELNKSAEVTSWSLRRCGSATAPSLRSKTWTFLPHLEVT